MAICRMFNLKENKKGYKADHLSRAIRYIQNPDKTEQMKLVDSVNCFPETALEQMMHTKKYFGKEDGRQGYHFVISFKPGEATVEQAEEIVKEFVGEYLEPRYETIWAIHTDHAHIHGHIIFNSVSFVDGIKYHYNNGDFEKDILPIMNRLCRKEELSTIQMNPDKPMHENYKDYSDRKVHRAGPKTMMMADLDLAIRQSDSFDDFLDFLKGMGYETKVGKYLSIRPPGRERFKRTYHFGKEYEIPEIKKRILRERPAAGQAERKAPILKLYKGNLRSRPALTKFQRRAFARMYKAGKLRRGNGGNYFRYREEILRFRKLKEEYLYITKNGVKDWHDLEMKRVDGLFRMRMLQKEKEEARKDSRKYYTLRQLLEEYRTYGNMRDADILKEGRKLGDSGMTEEQIESFLSEYEETRKCIRKKAAKVRKEMDIISRIEEEKIGEGRFCIIYPEKKEEKIGRDKPDRDAKRGTEKNH